MTSEIVLMWKRIPELFLNEMIITISVEIYVEKEKGKSRIIILKICLVPFMASGQNCFPEKARRVEI